MERKKLIIITVCALLLLTLGIIIGRAWNKTPKLENGEEVVAEMEGINITANDLYNKIKDNFARDVLIKMIDTAILEKIYETDSKLDAEIKGQITYIKEQTGENFLLAIKNQWGLNSEQELYDFIEISFKRNLAVEDYVKSIITEKEIEEYYEKNTVGDIKARHILIKPKVTEDMTSEEKKEKEDEALALAKDLIKQLDDGAVFEELALEFSDDQGSAVEGGDLGWFNKGKMVEAFEDAAFKLEKGQYSATPVKSDFGFHIILKEDEKEKPELEEAKETILKNLSEQKLTDDPTLNYIALEELRKEYKLVIHDSTLNKQYNDYLLELREQ